MGDITKIYSSELLKIDESFKHEFVRVSNDLEYIKNKYIKKGNELIEEYSEDKNDLEYLIKDI